MGLSRIRTSLRSKLMLALILIFFVPTVITLIFAYSYTYRDTRQNALAELQSMNDTKAEQIEKYLSDRLERADIISRSAELMQLLDGLDDLIDQPPSGILEDQYQDLVSLYGLMVKQLFVQAGFTYMAVVDREQGRLLFDHNFSYDDLGRRVKGDVQGGMSDTAAMVRTSGIRTVRESIKPGSLTQSMIYYGIPLYNASGMFSYVMIAGHSLEQIDVMVSMDYGGYSTRDIYMINRSSLVLTEPKNPEGALRIGGQYDNELIQEALKNYPSRRAAAVSLDRTRTLASYAPVRGDRIDGMQSNISWLLFASVEQAEIDRNLIHQFLIIIAVVLLFGLGVLFVAMVLARGIADPIDQVTREMKKFSEGDLTFSVETKREDEIGELVKSVGEMVRRLRDIIHSLQSAVTTTTSVGSTISSSVQQQSAISVEQAGSISEISSTMDEFTSSFGQVSENVSSVSKLSDDIFQKITESSGLIESVSQKIRDIDDDNNRDIDYIMDLKNKSKDISKIMEIIYSISDQTKIISFNAALEASSAGEAGKRFGVVAAEIRKLTEDVIQSTSHIDTLISEIQALSDKMVIGSEKTTKNIKQGLDYSGDSVENIEMIVGSIKKSNESTKQIVLAVQQQQTAATQIQSGLKELSEGARQNSEAIQAINESGGEFKEISGNLQVIIDQFRTEQS